MSNGYLTGCGLVISIIITFVLFIKKTVNNSETRLFKKMIVLNVLEALTTTMIVVVALTSNSNKLFVLLNRIDVNVIIWWCTFFLLYICNVCHVKNIEKIRRNLFYINIVYFVFSLFLDVNIIVENDILDSSGPLTTLGFCGAIFYIILMLFTILRSLSNKPNMNKLIPFYFLISGLILIAFLRAIVPQVNFISIMFSILDLIMFFTIENPDLKMLEEYNKNRELVETGFEERANLLFKITQDVKNPIKKIKLYSDKILESDDIEENNEMAYNISQISGNLIDMVDEVLSISTLDRKNVKIYSLSYDVYNIFNQIIYITKSKLDKAIEFKYSISNTIPTKLDGDSLKLKQIICSLLLKDNKSNSIVDLDISYLIKDDICRLIITISKTASNLSLHDVNEILSSNIEINKGKLEKLDNLVVDYDIVKKLVDLLNGNFIIKTDDKEITFTIIIDQLIDKNYNDNTVLKLVEKISNKKKVLLVDDDYKELTALSNELKKNNFDVDAVMYGEDAITKLASDEKYDILLIDDEMASGNAVVLIGRIDELKLNDLVKIVMLDGKKESIKKHYINDYSFVDCLIKDNYKEEIKRIKEQYK